MGREGAGRSGGRNPSMGWRNEQITGGAIPGGMIPRDDIGRIPSPVVSVKSKNPIAGPQLVTTSKNNLAQLAYYTTPDNRPRKATIIITQNSPIVLPGTATPVGSAGLYAKITYGPDRGGVSQWIATPCVFPVEGQFIKVEGLIGTVPFFLENQGAPGSGVGTLNGGVAQGQCTATCLIIDGWTDEGPSILLVPFPTVCSAVPAPNSFMVQGPVIIDEILLTNTSTTATVLMGIYDGANGLAATLLVAHTYVPPQTTVSVGVDLLGAFGQGLNIYGINGLSAHPSQDANDANVYASIRGRYLLPQGF